MDIYFIIIVSMTIIAGLSLLIFGIYLLLPDITQKKNKKTTHFQIFLPTETNPKIDKH